MACKRSLRLIDIGANLTDPVFRGVYRGRQAHPNDFDDMLKRAVQVGVEKIIVTGGTLSESKAALKLSSENDQLYCTVGCHPTRCKEFEHNTTPDQYLQDLLRLADENKGKVVAIGECGLDYDRLQFCPKPLQLKFFEYQLQLSHATGLPMFLHCRNSFADFMDILHRNREKVNGGVVHSFTGTLEEAMGAIQFGLYIGINGCSLKTAENLKVVGALPLDKLLIETDAPWCDIRPTHASCSLVASHFPSKRKERWEAGTAVKSRNEPRNVVQVLEVLSKLHSRDTLDMAEQIYSSTCKLFNWTD